MKKCSRACQSPEKGDDCASNNLFSHKKKIRSIIDQVGYISDIQIFDICHNRRIAISLIGEWTTGKHRMLIPSVINGERIYRFSEHYKAKIAAEMSYQRRYTCHGCPAPCVLLITGGPQKLRSICPQFPSQDNRISWEECTGRREP